LERVLDNLIANAIKFSPDGGPITVTLARERDGAGEWALLAVRDEGVGIPASDLPRLFERFHRASNVVDRIGGAGIGLATVRHLVEQHGGTVAVASEEGRGSAFSVRVPIHAPAH
jgi:signal transduction histidine kinase